MEGYMTIKEASAKWGIRLRRINTLCNEGRIEDAVTKKRVDAVSKANATISSETSRKQTAESTLASLGVFKFGEKKNQKAIIEEATKKISDAQSALFSAESVYKSEMAAAGKNQYGNYFP